MNGNNVQGWGSEMAAMGGGGDINGIVMQIAKLFAQLVPAMMGAPGAQAQAARFAFPGAVAGAMGGPIGPRVQGQTMMGLSAMSAMQDVTGAGGPLPGGFGLGMGATGAMLGGLGGMVGTGPSQMRPGEFAGMMGLAGQGGFFRGVSDIRAAREQMRTLVRTITELHHELNLSVEEVTSDLAQLRQMGGITSVSQGADAYRSMMGTSMLTGMAPGRVAGFAGATGQQLRMGARIPMASAFGAAMQGLQTVGGAARAGYLSEEMLFNATGMGGEEGAMALTGQIQSMAMQQSRQPRTRYMMAAALDPRTGQNSQEGVQQIMSGQMNIQDIESMANRNISQVGGQAAWMGMEPALRGQFMAATGGMGGLAFAQGAMRTMGLTMDPNDPRSLAYFQRLTGANDPMQAQAMMATMNAWGDMRERSQTVEVAAARHSSRAAEVNRRMQAADMSRAIGDAVDTHMGRVTRPLETAIVNMSERAADALTGAPVSITTAGGLTSMQEEDVSAFYRRVSRRGGPTRGLRTGADIQREIAGQRQTIEAYDVEMGAVAQGTETRRRMEEVRKGYEDTFRTGIGMMMFENESYWGGQNSDMLLSRDDALKRMASQGAGTEGAEEYAATRAGREALVMQYGRATAAAGSEEALRRELSQRVRGVDFTKGGTIVEALRGATTEQIGQTMSFLTERGGGTAGGQGWEAMVSEVQRGVSAAGRFTGGGRVSLGVADIAAGIRTPDTAAEQIARAGRTLGLEALGGTATGGPSPSAVEGIMNTLQSRPEILARMSDWIRSQGEGWRGTVGQAMAGAGVTAEQQKDIFGEDILSLQFKSRDKAVDFLETTGQARMAQTREDLLAAGALGEDAKKQYEKYLSHGGEEGRTATTMYRARALLEAGEEGAARSLAGGELQRVSRLGGRRYREALGALTPEAAQDVERLRGLTRGSSRGGAMITLEEARGFGTLGEADLRGALGEGLYERAAEGKLTGAERRRVSEKLEATLAQSIVPPAAGKPLTAETPAGAPPGTAPLADALKTALGQVPQVNVYVKNFNELPTAPSASNNQQDSGGGVGYFQTPESANQCR